MAKGGKHKLTAKHIALIMAIISLVPFYMFKRFKNYEA